MASLTYNGASLTYNGVSLTYGGSDEVAVTPEAAVQLHSATTATLAKGLVDVSPRGLRVVSTRLTG